jgi:diguanylate cyclase (GGDEF)-like protein
MRFGIAPKLTLLLTSFGLLAMGFVGYYAYANSRVTLQESVQRDLLTATQVLGRQFETGIHEIAGDTCMLASLASAQVVASDRLSQPKSPEAARLVDAFKAVMAVRPAYMQIRLISATQHGLELVRVDRDGRALLQITEADLQEKAHYAYVFNTLRLGRGQVYLSDISINHEEGAHAGLNRPTVRVATPVMGADGRVVGLVVINLDLNSLFDLLRSTLPNAYQVYLSNHWGDYLIHPDPAETFGFDAGRRVFIQDTFKPVDALIKGVGESVVTSLAPPQQRNDGLVAAFVRLPYGAQSEDKRFVILGLSQPMTNVIQEMDRQGWKTAQMIALVGFLSVILAMVVARRVTRPLKLMTRAMALFSENQTVSHLNFKRQDEIGVLAASLNVMQNTLVANLHELNESREAIRHLAQHDGLTGLPNRALFADRLLQALAQAQRDQSRLAVMFVDLDGFKPINDTYGHQVGDSLLTALAQSMQACVRNADTVGRVGGDEFVVLLPWVQSVHDATVVAEKICHSINQVMVIDGHSLVISASIGVAIYPDHAKDQIALIRQADEAMYVAKNKGGNQVCTAGE